MIDSTTNFVEHPRLVAQRIGRYADIVGRERVIAGVDCGFGTAVRTDPMVVDSIVWAKLRRSAKAPRSPASGCGDRRRRDRRYLIASGLTGEPTAPVIGIAGATNRNS